jgi:hypothetical protein
LQKERAAKDSFSGISIRFAMNLISIYLAGNRGRGYDVDLSLRNSPKGRPVLGQLKVVSIFPLDFLKIDKSILSYKEV